MKKINVVFVTDRMILGHGVDLAIDKIAAGLCKSGYDCEIYCNNFDETFKKQRPFKLKRLPNITSRSTIDLESKIKKTELILNNQGADIFIINSFPFYGLAGHLNKPVISINYGVILTQALPLKRKLFYKYMDFSQNYFYFRKSSAVISISSYLNNKLPAYLRKKSGYIHLGSDHYIETEISEQQIKEFRSSFDVKEDDCLLLYVGRLNPANQPYKGTKELIELFHLSSSQNSRIKLMMVGFGSGNDEIAIRNEGVLSITNAPWEMMPLIYSSCDIYATCTKWEGFDLPVVEAQSFGKPSICYNLCAHPEISKDSETGFLVNTKEEFLSRILELSSDITLRNKMSLSAKKNSKSFTWEKTVYQYDRIIKKILGISGHDFNLPGSLNEVKKEAVSSKNIAGSKHNILNIADNDSEIIPDKASPGNKNASAPDVSVIIINYNSSLSCLRECIQSLQSQTYRKIEIIVFDNASTNSVIDSLPASLNPDTEYPDNSFGNNAEAGD
ncbi:MAG: glycosyltransferase, partial [Candidatus Humimicrobiaceae bacterium]